ncbi:MAG TPA: hypothetical protein PKN36_00705 [bacterium]|jgi:chromosome segregation ATPase|nr:hypothetical protein [bacterium]
MKLKKNLILLTALFLMQAFLAMAQEAPARERRFPDQSGQRPDRSGQRFDPQQMNERYFARIKETLAVGDDEWEVLKPKIEKVRAAQMNAQRMGGMGRRQPGASADVSPVQKAVQELQTVLANKDATPRDISAKLSVLREARKNNEKELSEARKELRELLTQKQEAQLVMMGLLD